MYHIQLLDWDTDFFGYNVGKVSLPKGETLEFDKIAQNDFDLIYLYTEQSVQDHLLKQWGAQLQDIKIEFIKDVNPAFNYSNEVGNLVLKPINNFSEELFHLVLESGVYSRFKQDQNFKNKEFQRLYKAWIDKALSDIEGKVIGAFINNELLGFVSLSLKLGVADIGLIAVHEKARGKHFGKRLLESAYEFAANNQSKAITVVTQEFNIQAMQFYQHNGFSINKKNYIYHLWKNKQ
jgi:dTDP-4-amino-4,6-dideoxy-D-galactose acyltransferase